jgi:hypothetical protein
MMALTALCFFIVLSPFGFLSLDFYFITLIGKTKPSVPTPPAGLLFPRRSIILSP